MPHKSSTDTLKRFNGIFLKGIAPPACSQLYSPEPVGIGTPMVESLTSYIVRVSFAHCVTVGTLIGREIAPLIDKGYLTDKSLSSISTQFMYIARAVNGVGVTAEDWINVLQVLTMRRELRLLTMLPWKNLTSDMYLLRETRAWCPDCYEEWHRQRKPIYDPLLWSLEAVTVCPDHKRFLLDQCLQCKKLHPALPRFSLPGYCPHCFSWLGDVTSDCSAEAVVPNKDQLDWHRYAVEQIGDVFKALYQGASLQRELVPRLISTCIQLSTRGNLKAFVSRFNSFSYPTITNWLKGSRLPTLGRLIEICYRTGVSVKDIIFEEYSGISLEPAPIRSRDSYYLTIDDIVRIEATLALMLEENPPPSRLEVSKRIGCHVYTLRTHFPKLFGLIEERFSNNKAEIYDKEKSKSSLIAAQEENPPCSLSSVAKRLGCSRGFLRLHFPEDCNVISNRYVESRKAFVDIDDTRAKLLALQSETPPLSIIQCTKRLGCSKASLRKYFPEITKAIGIRYYNHCQKLSKNRRERRNKIIRATIAALEAEQIRPSSYQVRKRLTDLEGLSNREVEAVLCDIHVNSPKNPK